MTTMSIWIPVGLREPLVETRLLAVIILPVNILRRSEPGRQQTPTACHNLHLGVYFLASVIAMDVYSLGPRCPRKRATPPSAYDRDATRLRGSEATL